ncbi:MAG: hypothetical protein IPP71_20165 [Bacteroidetes bacterium]|nr:hypothetical protein [Bacteroidota bacterium]
MQKKTKIVATIGPASNSYEKLVELYQSGECISFKFFTRTPRRPRASY